jgi:hypothetical protein
MRLMDAADNAATGGVRPILDSIPGVTLSITTDPPSGGWYVP